MQLLKRIISSCLVGKGRSTIAIFLAILISCGLIAPPPAVGAAWA